MWFGCIDMLNNSFGVAVKYKDGTMSKFGCNKLEIVQLEGNGRKYQGAFKELEIVSWMGKKYNIPYEEIDSFSFFDVEVG